MGVHGPRWAKLSNIQCGLIFIPLAWTRALSAWPEPNVAEKCKVQGQVDVRSIIKMLIRVASNCNSGGKVACAFVKGHVFETHSYQNSCVFCLNVG